MDDHEQIALGKLAAEPTADDFARRLEDCGGAETDLWTAEFVASGKIGKISG